MKDYPEAFADAVRRTWHGMKRAASDWRWWAALAAVGLVGCVATAMYVLIDDRAEAQAEASDAQAEVAALRDAVADSGALDACRARLALGVTAAQAQRDIADDEVTISIGVEAGVEIPFDELPPDFSVEPLGRALLAQIRAELDLEAAVAARRDYEANPTTDCPEETP